MVRSASQRLAKEGKAGGRGSHSFTFQLNLSHV